MLAGECTCKHECQQRMCVSRVPIFFGLEPGQLEEIASLILQSTYCRGEFIALKEANLRG